MHNKHGFDKFGELTGKEKRHHESAVCCKGKGNLLIFLRKHTYLHLFFAIIHISK